MKTDWKKMLKEAYEAPEPLHKEVFLKKTRLPRPEISTLKFVTIQARYIRKRIWALSAVMLLLAIAGAYTYDKDMLWMISALLPFLAVSVTAENGRSVTFGMGELEMACCFSLKSVILARMTILGAVQMLLLILLIPLSSMQGAYNLRQTGVYLLVPYLLTIIISLELTRRIQGKEAGYACIGVAVMVSAISCILKDAQAAAFLPANFHWWTMALVVLLAFTVREYYKMIQQTEEMTWKLS